MAKHKSNLNDLSKIISVVSLLQVASIVLATVGYYKLEGFDGLGFSMLFGGIFVLLGVINLLLIAFYVYKLRKQNQPLDRTVVISMSGVLLVTVIVILYSYTVT